MNFLFVPTPFVHQSYRAFSFWLACSLVWFATECTFAQTSTGSPVKLPPVLGQRQTGVDWPLFLGPTGDSKSTETGIISPWPANGLQVVWDKPLAESYC
ncbi:MAG: hypothetical protein KDA87_15075, partial [Planctomycetales bacterium]|nr:hypothetical protein [Planctomycetales bacterium]